jgi:hypothetical protein
MSTPASTNIPGVGTLPQAPASYPRHALGLPAGSVRALVALTVLAALWLIALFGLTKNNQIPTAFVYLQYVMILILAHFFAAHGNTIGKHISRHNPLWLPGGFVRFFLLFGYLGLVGWLLFYERREFEQPTSGSLLLPLVLLTLFMLGYLFTKVIKMFSPGGQVPFWFQDIQAWLALLSMLGLLVIVLLHLFILKDRPENLDPSSFGVVEMIVAGIIGFYFGARS